MGQASIGWRAEREWTAIRAGKRKLRYPLMGNVDLRIAVER